MNPTRTPLAGRLLAGYVAAPRRDRAHVRLRWWSCPFPQVLRQIPRTGRVLDVGCGHGLLSLALGLRNQEVQVLGIDVDARKLDVADAARRQLGLPDVRFARSTRELPDGPWDAVAMVDVLQFVDDAARRSLLEEAAARLAPGGRLLVKELDRSPHAKRWLAERQERLSAGRLGLTRAAVVNLSDGSTLRSELEAVGLCVAGGRVDAGFPHPHLLLVGTASGPSD